MSGSIRPLQKMVERLASEPEKLTGIRNEMLELAQPYFSKNTMHQDDLLVKATAR